MRLARGALAIGFLGLIASLFWDPVSAELTRPDNLASPFHLGGQAVIVQGQALVQPPYAMTNRIWWSMLVPALPLFFMVTGHETWRRVCPLSFISQIPRYLGWNRTRARLSRQTGRVETQLALVAKGGFWQRHVWEIQFCLFFLALNARILFMNGDRKMLGLFLLGTIALAFMTGLLWGGKTWCNYICPVAIVQKIYTQPRGGLFESQANISGDALTQSMCRTSTPAGDRTACVGCTVNCPDIDIERSYWENVTNPNLAYIYYGFFGLIIGFYSWYYLYAGNWDYYFSGAWTHDPVQPGKLWRPGVILAGEVIHIPVIVSTPLILGAAVAIAMLAGKLGERIYRAFAKRSRREPSEAEILNRCLAFSAYLSINAFYVFGGRPNLMLLPAPVTHLVDFLIVALSTIWFARATRRSPARYRREGLAASLLEQLRKLPVDIGRYLEGRKVDELGTDEIYILAKTLPGFSRDQRMRAYRNILREAIQKGAVDGAASLEHLREIRLEIGVTDDEHREALQALELDGVAEASEVGASSSTLEDWFRVESYQRWLEPLLVARFGKGQSLSRILEEIGVVESVAEYRAIYQISEAEQSAVLAAVAGGDDAPIARQARSQLDLLAGSAALIFGLRRKMLSGGGPNATVDWPLIGALLIAGARRRADALYLKLFALLITLGDGAMARSIAMHIARLGGADIEEPLAKWVAPGARTTWAQSLPASLVDLLRGARGDQHGPEGCLDPLVGQIEWRRPEGASSDLAPALAAMVAGVDPLLGALALAALADIDSPLARKLASERPHDASPANGLMSEVIAGLDGRAAVPDPHRDDAGLALIVLGKPEGQSTHLFDKDTVTVGGAPDNDLVVEGLTVAAHHVAIRRSGSEVVARRADSGAGITIDGARLNGASAAIWPGARLGLAEEGTAGPVVVVEWAPDVTGISLETDGTLRKILWLSQVDMFRDAGLPALADVARLARTWRCGRGALLCRAGEASRELLVLAAGAAEVFTRRDKRDARSARIGPHALLDADALVVGSAHKISVRVSSAAAYVLTINGERLRALMERNASLSLTMFGAVAAAAAPEITAPPEIAVHV